MNASPPESIYHRMIYVFPQSIISDRKQFNRKTISLLLFLVVLTFTSNAQNAFQFGGQIKEAASQHPVDMAIISIAEINLWTNSNEKGVFLINNVPSGRYTVIIHCLGYQETSFKVEFTHDILDKSYFLPQENLALQEVTVTAKESKFGSASKIGIEAIAHIQPKSLEDIMQLLPGQVTENPSLASPGQIKLREISDNDNSSLGALVLVNGSPQSNDANLQVMSTAKSGTGTSLATTSGKGIDLREISAENIESVEVIRGIPSSEYGNLTSGVVIVKTKMGETPYEAKLKVDPNSKIASINKGFGLKNKGIVNTNVDYAQSYDDIRYRYKGYKRVTGSLGYFNTFLKASTPLTLMANVSGFRTLDEEKTDPQLKSGEIYHTESRGIRTSLSGRWMIRMPWITNVEYNFSSDVTKNNDFAKKLVTISSGAVPLPTSKTDGEYAAQYLPAEYFSKYTLDGKPFNLYGKIKGDLSGKWGDAFNKIIFGTEWSTSGNKGKGLVYNIDQPPFSSLGNDTRPRAFSDIPSLHTLSLFLEDKIKIPIGTTAITIQGGVRYSNIQPQGIFSSKVARTIEPRTVLRYEILHQQNNKLFNSLNLNLGFGIAAKAPTLVHLYPDKAYFDQVSFNYLDGTESLAVITTKVIENTSNPDLKPAYNKKKEIGVDFRIGQVSASITAYHERMNDGFSFISQPVSVPYRKFTVEGAGKSPSFENGDVYYNNNGVRTKAPYQLDTIIDRYNIPMNDETLIKKGIEYTIDMGKIQAIRTSFILDGAWLYVENYHTKPTYEKTTTLYNGKLYPYLAIMPAGQKTIRHRFNTNIRVVTHIPEVRLVVSFTTQIIWVQRLRYLWEDENGTPYAYYYQDGIRIDGSKTSNDNMQQTRYVDPIAFVDKLGNVHSWKKEYSLNPLYQPMVNTINSYSYFVQESLPPAFQFNFRLTKEFADNLKLSFMANNFLNMNRMDKSQRTSQYVSRNTNFYFGAELSYLF